MKLKPISTEAEYDAALTSLDKLFDAEPGTAKGDELEVLALLIQDYEQKHYPIDPTGPIEATKGILL